MRSGLIVLVAGLAACSTKQGPPDSGPDSGPMTPPLSDGGAIGAACSSLLQCAGNPLCPSDETCSIEVICADLACAEAGGDANAEAASLAFAVTPLPDYLQVYLFAPELVKGGTLDCPTLLTGLDAGMLSLNDVTTLNPLVLTYEENVPGNVTSSQALMFDVQSAPTGAGRVLYMEGYYNDDQTDGGDLLVGRVCTTFSDTDAGLGMTSATMSAIWP